MTGLAEEYSFLFTRRYSGLSFNTLCRPNILKRCVQTASLSLLKITESSKVGVTIGSGKTLPTHFRPSSHSTYSVIAAPRRPHGSSAEEHITSWPTLVVMWHGSSSSWQWREEALASVRQSSICRVTYSWRSRSSCSNSTSTADKKGNGLNFLYKQPRAFINKLVSFFLHAGILFVSVAKLSPAPSWSQSWIDYIRNVRPVFYHTVCDSMGASARTEALLHHKFITENILTGRAGISLVVTFHTSPSGWRRHLGEVFPDHLDYGTLFLLSSDWAFSESTCAADHPEYFVRSSALCPGLMFRVSSMDELRCGAAAALRFYRPGWGCAWVGGASPFGREGSWFAAHAIQAGVAPLTCAFIYLFYYHKYTSLHCLQVRICVKPVFKISLKPF